MNAFEKSSEWQRLYYPMVACNVSKSGIFEFAEKVAKKIKFNPGDDIEAVVRKNGGRIHYMDPLADPLKFRDEDGSIFVHKPNDFDILLPSYTGPLRDRFTIAHELGHYVLHTPHENSWAARRGSTRIEWEANWFAAGFLMPTSEFRDAIGKLGRNAFALAAHFNVSLSAAETRLNAITQ